MLAGPGKVGAALELDTSWSGHALHRPGGLTISAPDVPVPGVLVGPRVGIDFAEPVDRDRPWRFAIAGSEWVTRPRELSPE
jgi:DNA-3-methyladenine glycosylase